MKEYKGFLICEDKYYIQLTNIDQTKEYYNKNNFLLEKDKATNRLVCKLKEYFGNQSVYDAIDVYDKYINKSKNEKYPAIIFDFWFNVLALDAKSFLNTFKGSDLKTKLSDLEQHTSFWIDFRVKDSRMEEFLTDLRIKEMYDLYIENKIIETCVSGDLNELLLFTAKINKL